MPTRILTITDFLRARFDEDEADARRADESVEGLTWRDLRHVLADIEGKRRIVEEYQMWSDTPNPDAAFVWNTFKPVVRALALPYANHSDFNPAWAL